MFRRGWVVQSAGKEPVGPEEEVDKGAGEERAHEEKGKERQGESEKPGDEFHIW